MSGEGHESIPTSADPRSKRPVKKRALTPVSEQAAGLDALFARPDQEIRIPSGAGAGSGGNRPQRPPPPEIVTNVQGSSAGAGSGEFHVYKAARRREYERLRAMDEEVAREHAATEFERSRREREARDEEKTRRNREKREKLKARKAKARAVGGAGAGAGAGAAGQKENAVSEDGAVADNTRDGGHMILDGANGSKRTAAAATSGNRGGNGPVSSGPAPVASTATNGVGLTILDDD